MILAALSRPWMRPAIAAAAESEEFDFYISPTGSDSNDGLTTSTPWAITALNTKRATYAGTRVGLMDGTYSTDGMTNAGGGNNPALALVSGTEGSPTIIQAVNPRMAILDDNHYARADHGAIIGLIDDDIQYIELRDLKFIRSSQVATYFHCTTGRGIGLKYVNCEFDDGLGWDADNNPYIYLAAFDDTEITNCYFHDLHGENADYGCMAILNYGCKRTVARRNTCHDAHVFFQSKYASGSPRTDDQEHTITENFIYDQAIGLWGFDNKDQTGSAPNDPPYLPYIVKNNVFVDIGNVLDNAGAFCAASQMNVYNNTVVQTAAGAKAGWNLHTWQAGDGYEPSYYNNIYYHGGSVSWNEQRALTCSINGSGAAYTNAIDYNCYGPSSMEWRTQTGYGYPYTAGGANYTARTSSSAWQSATGKDANSLFATDPLFTNTGSGAAVYQLQGGSPCRNAGHVGGSSGGATVHIGAWDGVVSQIGCDFA